jgi:transposase
VSDALAARLDALEALVVALREENRQLKERVETLEAKLRENSSNSGRPPSSDSRADREQRGSKPKSRRRRGAQRGHDPHRRELAPPEKVRRFEDCFPERCRRCDAPLPRRRDDDPLRHQVVELPEIEPDITEYRRHRVACACGVVTCGLLPEGIPASMTGPRLTSLIALLTAMYQLSRRQAQSLVGDVLGVQMSLGAVSESEERISEAIAPAVDEALDHASQQPIKHVDATGWRCAGESRTLWTIATTMVTVFAITVDATRAELRKLFKSMSGYLVSDRATQFSFWAMDKRQVCWAHLIRKFVAFSERSGDVGKLGDELLVWCDYLLDRWHRLKKRDGPTRRRQFQREAMVVRLYIEALLRRGVATRARGVSGSCQDILAHAEAMWTFVTVVGVEPTNNHAERELRAFVLWRKKSFGSQSQRGIDFARRLMTVVHTLRKQGRHVLSFLTEAYQATLRRTATPSLLPAP